jgi:CubicO group peptidase (beta-lactamase class C family)
VAGQYVYQCNGPQGRFPGPSGGLACTIDDYFIFAQMLGSGGVAPNGARILGSATVELMRSNHLPAASAGLARDLGDLTSGPAGMTNEGPGVGFGLSVAVVTDPVKCGGLRAAGEYHWLGGCCTTFWIDPANAIVVVFFSQVQPGASLSLIAHLH